MTAPVVLVTGASVFLGTEVSLRLWGEGCAIAALVRARDDARAALRLRRAWWHRPELTDALGKGVRVFAGDVSQEGLGLDHEDRDWLARNVTHVLHSAADLRLHAPQGELDATNVLGTARVLDLAEEAHDDHGLSMFGHVSTAYIAGDRAGIIEEGPPLEGARPQSNYERSKLRGELLARERMGRLPVTVLRPGMVVGDSTTGRARTFNTIYYPLRLYLEGRLRLLPISGALRVHMVPVDHVAEAAASLLLRPEAQGVTFHLTAPSERSPTIRELLAATRDWALDALGVRLPAPVFMPLPPSLRDATISRFSKGEAANLRQLTSYFKGGQEFSRKNLDRFIGPYQLHWRAYLPRLLGHAAYTGFLHMSGRTVHEQALFRLGREGRRVACFDVVEGDVVEAEGGLLRQDILRAASALTRLGIGKGDRAAIVGLNSTRYLVLEVALGMVGAVSVPLYYTSPPKDIGELCRASGAKLLLVGTRSLLERIEEADLEAKVVSFCRGAPFPGALGWEEFLASGEPEEREMAPVAPDDLATLRFTSSTTGSPKAARFTHRHLLYMAESMASLPPWPSRHRPVRYLSYLPMNHVVEGLLATYAPYYAPTSLDIYFLEDFKDLRGALPKVRPSIFFSVPRFYEKLWDAINGTRLGSGALRGRPPGSLLRALVRRSALRRAGLDACDHLIVGSGPMSDRILEDLHRVGIEVHNAYGLTEAPLVTLNRKGRNRIGTVGEPLPLTEVRTAPDGEVLVRGPQVTSGYEGLADSPLQDGWLRTGDLGETSGGYLVLRGRKKELMKTSYGKFVSPMRVESLLRDSPLVAEALLVGEGRPFCAALLWTEGRDWDAQAKQELDAHVRGMNARLSQPERVRRWAVVGGGLSIDRGEVTANLKLRRARVESKYQDLLSALYSGQTRHPDALHIGEEGA